MSILRLILILILVFSMSSAWADNEAAHPWSLEFKDQTQDVIIKETGEIILKLSYRTEHFKETLNESDRLSLFKLAAEPAFQKVKEEYLATEGRYAEPQNCNQLVLENADGQVIHKVLYSPDNFPYSPQPKEAVPTIVRQLAANIVWLTHTKFDFLFPKCGYQPSVKDGQKH
jgi:hypothetical protein